jgi:hypothetical protein
MENQTFLEKLIKCFILEMKITKKEALKAPFLFQLFEFTTSR